MRVVAPIRIVISVEAPLQVVIGVHITIHLDKALVIGRFGQGPIALLLDVTVDGDAAG